MNDEVAREDLLSLEGSSTVIRIQGDKVAVRLPFMAVGHRWTDINLEDYQQVYLERRVVRNRNNSRTYFSIGLEGIGTPLDLGEIGSNPHGAAESVAKFLNLGMADRSGGEAIVRDAESLDDSLRQQAAKSLQRIPCPPHPGDPQATFQIEDQTITFVIPGSAPEPKAKNVLVSVVLTLGACCVSFAFMLHWFLGLCAILGTVAFWQMAFSSFTAHWATPVTLTVSPEQLGLQTGGQSFQSFSAEEIEELKVTKFPLSEVASQLRVRSDRASGTLELRAGEPTNGWIFSTARYLLSEDPKDIDWDTLRSWA